MADENPTRIFLVYFFTTLIKVLGNTQVILAILLVAFVLYMSLTHQG